MPWNQTPQARALLSKIVASDLRPVGKCEVRALTRDDWHEYEGPLVDRLIAIRDAAGERALAKAHAGDRADMDAWIATGTVHDVIDAAYAAAALSLEEAA